MTELFRILTECVDDHYREEIESIDQIAKRIRIAVLESVREPSERMANAAPARVDQSTEGTMYHGIWRAMIDAAIKEVEAND